MKKRALLAVSLLAFVASTGCEVAKSSNPLSPSVAGPIAGVTITAPKPLEPVNGSEVEPDRPLTLLIENASSSGVRPLSLVVEIATDTEFSNKVMTREGIAPGDGGRTSYTLADKLESGRTYHWRVRAQDGANTGPFSNPSSFKVLEPASLTPPIPIAPVNGAPLNVLQPVFLFANSGRTGAVGSVTYTIEVARDQGFGQVVAVLSVSEQGGQTSLTLTQALELGTQYFWRVRASDGRVTSPWSPVQSFVMPNLPPAAPAPSPPAPAPPPSGGGGSCASNNPNYIISCISAKYPQRRAPVGSLGERQANMAFLRDRIIEAGLCGGLDLGWNLKRGGPELSLDFLVHRINGVEHGIDIAHDYDNIGTWLQLQWLEGEFPFYKAYPTPNCN